jgi:hypothetical protein
MTNPSAPTLAAPSDTPPASPGGHQGPRRFGKLYANFHGVGLVLRDPRFTPNRRGGATASFSMVIGNNRDLDILVAGRDLPELERALQGVRAGVTVTIDGFIIAPRINQREVPQFYAEHLTPHALAADATPQGPVGPGTPAA